MMPKVVWIGEFSDSLQDEIRSDVEQTVDYFAESFAIETNFADTTVMVWNGIDAAVKHEAAGRQPDFNISSPEQLRVKLEHDAGGWADDWGLVVAACWWDPPCPLPRGEYERGRDLMAHEWFHYLQFQIAARHWWTVSPEWMLEGTAIWGGDAGLRIADGVVSLADDRLWRKRLANGTSATLRSAEERNSPWQYHLGTLAIDLLIERSGVDAPIQYFRQLHPQVTKPERRWLQTPHWVEAFHNAFGLDADNFYKEFATWRAELSVNPLRTTEEPRLRGSVRHSDGEPATGFWINAAPYDGEHKAGRIRRNSVDEEGSFAIDLESNSVQRLWLTRDGCTLWLTDDGLTNLVPQPGDYRDLNTRRLPVLDLVLPTDACQTTVQVDILPLRGDDRTVAILLSDEANTFWATTDRYGKRSIYPSRMGQYELTIRIAGCDLYYQDGRLVASSEDARPVEVGEVPLNFEIRIPPELCKLRVSGRLIDGQDMPFHDVYVYISEASGDGTRAGVYTDEDGAFGFEAQRSGRYLLQFFDFESRCRGYYRASGATSDFTLSDVLTVADSDVTGIEFVVPDDPASLCG